MSRGVSVNWAPFAAERRKVREALRKKSEDRKEKREREREFTETGSGAVSAPSVLGKKRCSIPREDTGFPHSLSLSVKTECSGEDLAMAKKSHAKSGRATAYGPRWGRDEIEAMVKVIHCHEGLVKECKIELCESRREVEALADKLRREKLLLSDRQLMLEEVKLRLSRLSGEELNVECTVEEKRKSLADLGDSNGAESDALRRDISVLTAKSDGFAFKRAQDEVTERLCVEAIAGCTGEIGDLQRVFEQSTEKSQRIECRVSSLQSVLLSMRDQLKKMQVGDGAALYPVPLPSSLQLPLVQRHTLNACPVCSLWFECYDYVSVACGHTYHPYCLFEYTQKATKCLVPSCQETFAKRSLAALGIRPSTLSSEVKIEVVQGVTEEVIPAKNNNDTVSEAETGATTSPTLSWEKESPEKVRPLSQSSQTDATSKPCNLPQPAKKTPSPPEMCEVCGEKEVACYLKACGHNVFCFGCIQGRKECPICAAALSGWGRINPRVKPSLALDLPQPESEDVNTNAAKESTRTVEETEEDPVEDAVGAGASTEDSSDDSDSDNGMVHWCDSKAFSNGGARSHQDRESVESPMQEGETDLPNSATVVGSRGAKRFAPLFVLLDTVKTGPELEEAPSVRKRGRAKHPAQVRGKKFKNMGEMAADEIVGAVPGAVGTETEGLSDSEQMLVLRKRSVGCPPRAAKLSKHEKGSQVPKQTPVKSNPLVAVQQLRSALRRREVQDTIPVKFRRM